jgi:hypothetical protein
MEELVLAEAVNHHWERPKCGHHRKTNCTRPTGKSLSNVYSHLFYDILAFTYREILFMMIFIVPTHSLLIKVNKFLFPRIKDHNFNKYVTKDFSYWMIWIIFNISVGIVISWFTFLHAFFSKQNNIFKKYLYMLLCIDRLLQTAENIFCCTFRYCCSSANLQRH